MFLYWRSKGWRWSLYWSIYLIKGVLDGHNHIIIIVGYLITNFVIES